MRISSTSVSSRCGAVKQAEIDRGDRGGTTSEDAARIKALEQENRELKRASEILQRAASFFGAELDRRQK